jgi:hypothetical protein
MHILFASIGDGVDFDIPFLDAENSRRSYVGSQDDLSLAVGLERTVGAESSYFVSEGWLWRDMGFLSQ